MSQPLSSGTVYCKPPTSCQGMHMCTYFLRHAKHCTSLKHLVFLIEKKLTLTLQKENLWQLTVQATDVTVALDLKAWNLRQVLKER